MMLKVDGEEWNGEVLVQHDGEYCRELDLNGTIVTTPDGKRKLLLGLKPQSYVLTGKGNPPGVAKL